ncbi:MAG: ATP-binding protein, partial [Planctomycetaceae bacterium]|nr:ATP-binding protein [Planctomycetaceae bacterium]
YERSSVLITSNRAFADWSQVFQGERMTAALLDRFTHRCHIFEMNGESYRFRESMKANISLQFLRDVGYTPRGSAIRGPPPERAEAGDRPKGGPALEWRAMMTAPDS